MKSFFYRIVIAIAIQVIVLNVSLTAYAMTASGPSTVCPTGTYTYTVSGAPIGTTYYRWSLSYTGFGGGVVSSSSGSSATMDVTLSSTTEGQAYITFEALTGQGGLTLDSYGLIIDRHVPHPAIPNDGLVLFCGANESVTVTSSPYIPYNSTPASCQFHCAYLWQSPSGWNFQSGTNSPSNSVELGGTSNSLVSPGSVSNGANGTVYVSAEYSQCNSYANTTSSASLWVGTPAVSNGNVNGNSYSGGTLYVPSGYANLSVQIGGGGTTNWYVANGSGSLSPSYANCSVSWSGFVRVVIDASNRCGGGGSYTFYLTTQDGYYGYRVAPNPAKDKVSLLLDYKEMAGEVIQSVTLYDTKNKSWYSADSAQLKKSFGDKSSIDIVTKDLPRGTYFLHVKMGNDVKMQQIILE